MKSVKTGDSRGVKRRAILILAIFIIPSVMGSAALVLSEWTPGSTPSHSRSPVASPDSSSTLSFSFSYEWTDVGNVISGTVTVTVDYQYIDLGQAISVSYSASAGGVSSVTYYYNGGSSTSSTYTPGGTGTDTVGLEISTNDGTYGTTNGATVTVESDPTVSASTSQGTVDSGQSVTFSSSASGGYGTYSYQWYLNGAAVSGATSSSWTTAFSVSSTTTESVYVNLVDQTGYSVNSNTISETVDPPLSVSIASSLNPSDANQNVVYTASPSGGSGSYTNYNFYLNGGSIQSGTSNQWTEDFTSSGSNSVYVVVTDSNSYTAQSSTITQTVNSDPTVSISSSQNPTDVGNTIEFQSSVSGGTPGYSYSWSADGSSYTTQDINVSFSSSGTYSIDLTVKDAAGYSVSSSYSETVNSDPTVTASSNVSSADVNYPIEFSSSPSGGTGSYTYSWTLNGNQVSTSQDFSYSFSSSGSYTLTVTITDSVGIRHSQIDRERAGRCEGIVHV